MKTQHQAAYLASSVLLASLVSTAASASDLMQFSPHRAIYELSLADSSAGSGVSGVTGRMVYELDGSSCTGYTQKMRYVTVMTNQEGTDTLSDLRNSSWEEADGKKLKFSSTQYQNDQLADSSQGNAARAVSGPTQTTAGVDLIKPTKKRVPLPNDIYFPMKHADALVQAAKSGVRLFSANVYDGSEKGEKYYLTSTLIGKQFPLGTDALPAAMRTNKQLATVASWPLTIGYFDAGKNREDQTPSYELSFRYFENGVTSDLSINYGEFAIKGELKELTFLDQGKCPENATATSTSH